MDAAPSALNVRTFVPAVCTSDPEVRTVDLKVCTFDPEVRTVDLNVKTIDLHLETFALKVTALYPAWTPLRAYGMNTQEKKMANRGDWMPAPRAGILAMAHEQIQYMTAERRTAWGVPTDKFTEYGMCYSAAQTALQKVMDKAERTHVLTVECQQAFEALKTVMRFIRDRWHKIPPLTLIDWAALGYREKDTHPNPVPAPDAVPGLTLNNAGGPHILTAYLGPLAGTQPLDNESDYGYAIYVGVMPHGGATLEEAASVKHYLMTVPADGKGLLHYRFTRRKTERITFEAGESGMRAYACSRYENQKGDAGEWGPVAAAIIP
jgi:hypothetical protein